MPDVPAMPRTTPRDLKGRRVQFHLRDVYYPEPATLLSQLHGNDVLQGRVLEVSDSETNRGVFAAIKVARLRPHCFVAIDRVRPVRRSAQKENGRTT